ncbi:MAG: hypothetical protein QM775_24350 [Pirellulales bacterium]
MKRYIASLLAAALLFTGRLALAHEDFPIPANTEKDTASAPMPPDEVVRTVKLPPGFKLSVFAAEPDVHNPIAITFDERGRLWVAESYSWAGNGDGGFRAEIRDRILVFEDTDNDGRHDRRTVFWDDAHRLTSIEVGYGGVWAICLPNLLFIPDANRDDKPDGPPVVKLDGFDGGSGSHTPANGLKWGPDGWLYARQGIQVTSLIGKPGSSESQRLKFNTGIWRYHPVRGTVEAVMHGMTNSWGFDFDKHGEMFCINTVIGHLWHVVPGLHTERMYGADPNPYVFDLVKQTADHVHWDTGENWSDVRKGVSDTTSALGGGHAHIGLMIYQGDNWPAEYRDKAYTLNLHGRRINCDVLKRDGCTYTATHGQDLCYIADPWFRGMDLITGPDGGVFIADWSDTGECHDHDGVHRTSGRIYKLTYGEQKKLTTFDLSRLVDNMIVSLLSYENQWWARQARRILAERAAEKELTFGTADLLRKKFDQEPHLEKRIRILEALHAVGADDDRLLTKTMEANDEYLSAAALRFYVEKFVAGESSEYVSFNRLAEVCKDPLVLLHLASAIQRVPVDVGKELAAVLYWQGRRAGDDAVLPHLLWYGLEPHVARDPMWAVHLISLGSFPLIHENVARRVTLNLEQNRAAVDQMLRQTPNGPDGSAVVAGVAKALNGVRRPKLPLNGRRLPLDSRSLPRKKLANTSNR